MCFCERQVQLEHNVEDALSLRDQEDAANDLNAEFNQLPREDVRCSTCAQAYASVAHAQLHFKCVKCNS